METSKELMRKISVQKKSVDHSTGIGSLRRSKSAQSSIFGYESSKEKGLAVFSLPKKVTAYKKTETCWSTYLKKAKEKKLLELEVLQ